MSLKQKNSTKAPKEHTIIHEFSRRLVSALIAKALRTDRLMDGHAKLYRIVAIIQMAIYFF